MTKTEIKTIDVVVLGRMTSLVRMQVNLLEEQVELLRQATCQQTLHPCSASS